MLIIGEDLNIEYLDNLVTKSESLIKHTIKYTLIQPADYIELAATYKKEELLLLWKRNK
jgi:hypothetical protein